MRIKLAYRMTLYEVARAAGGYATGQDCQITHIVTNSKEVEDGDLFFALKGERYDGNDFAHQALGRGAKIVSTKAFPDSVVCTDSSDALLGVASHYKKKLKRLLYTVAVTGSVGKTTTKDMTARMLLHKYKTHKTKDNLNNKIGVAYTLLSAPQDTEALVVEMGMNHQGEISQLAKAAMPNIAIITNIGTAHIGNLGSRENIAKAKLEVLCGNPRIIITPHGEELLYGAEGTTFSTKDKSAHISLIERKHTGEGYLYDAYECGNLTDFRFHTDARYLAECAAAALCASVCCDVMPCDIGDISFNFGQNSRQNIICLNGIYFAEDFYNASEEAFRAGFEYVFSLNGYKSKSALIGDVMELGDLAADIHYEIGRLAAERKFRNMFIFGNFSKYVKAGALAGGFPESRIFTNENTSVPDITAHQILDASEPGDIIYAKASHATRLKRVIDAFGDLR